MYIIYVCIYSYIFCRLLNDDQILLADTQMFLFTAIIANIRLFQRKCKCRIEIDIRDLVYCRTRVNFSIRDVIVHLST